MSQRSLYVALALLVPSTPLAAQSGASAGWRPSHAAQLKRALRTLAAAQERHHATKKQYAASAEALRLPRSPGVRVEVLGAGRAGWHGRAVHQEQPGRSCVIFVGRLDGKDAPRTDGDREMAGEEGVPLCDRMR
jgi:hypothetical protein